MVYVKLKNKIIIIKQNSCKKHLTTFNFLHWTISLLQSKSNDSLLTIINEKIYENPLKETSTCNQNQEGKKG